MTAPLDEKARDAALAAWFANTAQGWHAAMEAAIRAYLAASPSPSEMEVVSTAWEGYWPGAGSISSTTKLTKDKNTAARWQDDGAEIESLVRASQAQSALAAMRAQKDYWQRLHDERTKFLGDSAAQVLRLTEENEALRKERTSLIETKREQIDRLELSRGAASKVALDAIARAEAAEARIKALEEALRPFAEDDGMVGVNSDYTNARSALQGDTV